MSTAKSLVDAQCGQANPLVQLSQNFSQNNAKVATGVERQLHAVMPSISAGDAMAQEYLARVARQTPAPVSFNMQNLIRQLPQSSSASNLSQQWGKEFLKTRPKAPVENFSAQWTQQYVATSPSLSMQKAGSSSVMELESAWSNAVGSSQGQAHPMMWSAEYLDKFDTDSQASQKTAESWADDYMDQVKRTAQNLDAPQMNLNHLYEDAWDSIMREEGRSPEDFLAMPFEQYKFVENNPFLEEANAVAKGSEMMTNGNIAEAIQYYEAAVIQHPQDSKAWTALGLCHAENEQDLQAISAFRRALEIDPQSQEALLAISVSYANESMENEALLQLEKWIAVYNKDQSAFQNATQRPNLLLYNYSSLDQNKFKEVENAFLDAARRQVGSVDPDLQNSLGVLYNLNRNFDRAVDSIKAALAVRPDDARLWNRLGATLANGDRTAEAISAYRQALNLFPTYVRARYNLGISCMHLKSYNEAVDHFLSALQIQRSPENSPIWSTMRSAVLRVDPPATPELLDSLDSRDPARFSSALNQHRSIRF